MKTFGGVLPWAVVLAAIGAAIWWLLSREVAAGRWLLAAVLIGHGVVHVLFAVPAPAATAGSPDWPFDMARSWVVTGAGVDLNAIRVVGVALIAIVVAGFGLSALSTVGVVVPPGWWRATVVVSSVASAIMLILFFEPQLVLGLGIDAVLLGVVATGAWAP
ncbi:MAG TPA: hypothetical protein VK194_02705 [Candidatus Deferrimicrobium sp.]|nr:hypothetical protein [Candidatus Deferrimicrobium sp.]